MQGCHLAANWKAKKLEKVAPSYFTWGRGAACPPPGRQPPSEQLAEDRLLPRSKPTFLRPFFLLEPSTKVHDIDHSMQMRSEARSFQHFQQATNQRTSLFTINKLFLSIVDSFFPKAKPSGAILSTYEIIVFFRLYFVVFISGCFWWDHILSINQTQWHLKSSGIGLQTPRYIKK